MTDTRKPPDPTPEQAAGASINAQVPVGLLDPKTLQILMASMMPLFKEMLDSNRQNTLLAIQELRKPTAEEAAKIAKEIERIKAQRLAAIEQGKAVAAIEKANQARCDHLKPNGMHTFAGQVMSDGWAEIRCQRCQLSFRVKPLPEHLQQGLQLEAIRGLTVAHLQAWQDNSKKIEERLLAQATERARIAQQFAAAAPIPKATQI